MNESVQQFWKKWMHLVFQEKMLSKAWRKLKRNVEVGDVVYMMDKEEEGDGHRLGVVSDLKVGEDGNVRTATVRYTNPGGGPSERSPPKWTERPIHKLAVIVPNGYRFEDDGTAPSTPEAEETLPPAVDPGEVARPQVVEDRPRRGAALRAADQIRGAAPTARGRRGRGRPRVYRANLLH